MGEWFKAVSGAIRRGIRIFPDSPGGVGARPGEPHDVARRYARARTERITLSIDPRRAQSYRIAVGGPSIWSDRPMERGWGRPAGLFEHLVSNMGVPPSVAAEKIADLERTGGPVSFESRHA